MKLVKPSALAIALCISISSPLYAEASFKDVYARYNAAIEAQDTQQAVNYAEQAYELGLIKFVDSPENRLNLKHNLALAYSNNKQADQAFQLMTEVLADSKSQNGEQSTAYFFALLDTLGTFDHMSLSELRDNKSQSRTIISQALDLAEHLAQQNPEQAAKTYYVLAKQLILAPTSSVFFDQALQATTLAESALMKSVGPTDVRTVEMQFKLGQFNIALRKRDKAIAYFESVVATVNSAMSTSHPYELASHANLVKLYEAKGESDSATEHCIAIGKLKPWQDEIEQMPLHRQEPKYPVRYVRKRAEGSVVMRFNIDDYGFVRDLEVVELDGGKLFAKAAKNALEKWRYAPKVENGVAVESTGHMVQLDFKIDT